MHKPSAPEEVKKGKKAVLLCLSEDKKNINLEEAKEILVDDVGPTVDPLCHLRQEAPRKDSCYDVTFEAKESKKEDLVFIFRHLVCTP